MDEEITFELTNYCQHNCKFCSTNVTGNPEKADFLSLDSIEEVLRGKRFKHIILSGGEPTAHPDFYWIHRLCEEHTDDVVVYSNLITHLVYNSQVIDGVYLEANVTLTPETDKIHILRRVKQGKEKNRPEVHLSRNHSEDCTCEHRVVMSDGKIVRAPCDKYSELK